MSDIVERLRQKERDYYQRDTGGAYGMGPVLRDAADEIERLQGLVAKGLAVVHDFLPNIGRCVLQDYQRMNEFCSEAAARTAVSAVQPERCCLDYPRCDCNSPPESEGAE